jgi:glycosyltransferase involved in cell wall biosynthesis
MSEIKILHLSAADEYSGAGKAALLTHNSLLENKIESRILFLKSNLKGKFIYSFHRTNLFSRILRLFTSFLDRVYLFKYRRRRSDLFSPGKHGLSLKNNELLVWADVIHIHWANHGFVSLSEISHWNKPVIWTMRDMWAFTGGCHYTIDCNNYLNSCGKCPLLGSDNSFDLSYKMLNIKKEALNNSKILWVTISNWMKEKAELSSIFENKDINVIYSGVSARKFVLGDRAKLRNKYNFHDNKQYILIGAANLTELYKGYQFVIEAINKLPLEIEIITFGSKTIKDGDIKHRVHHFGIVAENILQELFSIANLFLGPSIAEAFGKTFLEAQLCGCPVVCFSNTGPSEIIQHRITGYISKFKDNEDLLNGILFCLNNRFDSSLIRMKSLEKFEIQQIVKQYINLYEKCHLDWSNN